MKIDKLQDLMADIKEIDNQLEGLNNMAEEAAKVVTNKTLELYIEASVPQQIPEVSVSEEDSLEGLIGKVKKMQSSYVAPDVFSLVLNNTLTLKILEVVKNDLITKRNKLIGILKRSKIEV